MRIRLDMQINMNRWLGLCALASALFGSFLTGAAEPAGKHPNILFILVDLPDDPRHSGELKEMEALLLT